MTFLSVVVAKCAVIMRPKTGQQLAAFARVAKIERMAADLALVRELVAADHGLAIVSLVRADGSVHTSLVNAGLLDDPVGGEPVIGFVARGDARKLALIRRTGRAAVTFRSGWQWVAVEGPARVAGL